MLFGIAGIILELREECTSGVYGSCSETFDFSYTLVIWISDFITFLFMYGLGEIIKLLKKANEQLTKINK